MITKELKIRQLGCKSCEKFSFIKRYLLPTGLFYACGMIVATGGARFFLAQIPYQAKKRPKMLPFDRDDHKWHDRYHSNSCIYLRYKI